MIAALTGGAALLTALGSLALLATRSYRVDRCFQGPSFGGCSYDTVPFSLDALRPLLLPVLLLAAAAAVALVAFRRRDEPAVIRACAAAHALLLGGAALGVGPAVIAPTILLVAAALLARSGARRTALELGLSGAAVVTAFGAGYALLFARHLLAWSAWPGGSLDLAWLYVGFATVLAVCLSLLVPRPVPIPLPRALLGVYAAMGLAAVALAFLPLPVHGKEGALAGLLALAGLNVPLGTAVSRWYLGLRWQEIWPALVLAMCGFVLFVVVAAVLVYPFAPPVGFAPPLPRLPYLPGTATD